MEVIIQQVKNARHIPGIKNILRLSINHIYKTIYWGKDFWRATLLGIFFIFVCLNTFINIPYE